MGMFAFSFPQDRFLGMALQGQGDCIFNTVYCCHITAKLCQRPLPPAGWERAHPQFPPCWESHHNPLTIPLLV